MPRLIGLPGIALGGAHLLHEVNVAVASRRLQTGQRLLGSLVRSDGSHHHARRAQTPGQRPSIDSTDSNDAVVAQVLLQPTTGTRVAGHLTVLPHDEAANLDATRLDIAVIDAVVADKRVGQDEDLAGVGRIGQHLLIAGHAGAEHDLTIGMPRRAQRVAAEHGAVFKDETCVIHRFSGARYYW